MLRSASALCRQRATAAATAATAEQPTAHKSSLADQSRALSLALGVASRPSTTGPATSEPPQHNAAPTHAAQAHSVSPSAFGKLVEPGNAQSPVEARHSVREPSHAAQQGRPSGFLQPTADGRPMEVIGSDVEYEMVCGDEHAVNQQMSGGADPDEDAIVVWQIQMSDGSSHLVDPLTGQILMQVQPPQDMAGSGWHRGSALPSAQMLNPGMGQHVGPAPHVTEGQPSNHFDQATPCPMDGWPQSPADGGPESSRATPSQPSQARKRSVSRSKPSGQSAIDKAAHPGSRAASRAHRETGAASAQAARPEAELPVTSRTAEAEAAAAPEAPLRRAQGPANSLARQALRGALGGQRGIGAPARASPQAASPGPRATVDAAVPALGGQRGIGAPARPSPQAASPGSKAATDAAVQPTATPMHGSQHPSKIGTAADAADFSEPIGIHSKQHCSQMAADSSGTEPHGSSMRPASAAITHGAAPLAGPPSSAQSPAPGAPRAAPAGRRNPRRAPEASAALDTFATSRQEEAAAFQPDEAAPGTSGQASQDGRQATPAGRREKPAHRSRRQEGRPVDTAQPSSWSQTQDEWERDGWSATADAQVPWPAATPSATAATQPASTTTAINPGPASRSRAGRGQSHHPSSNADLAVFSTAQGAAAEATPSTAWMQDRHGDDAGEGRSRPLPHAAAVPDAQQARRKPSRRSSSSSSRPGNPLHRRNSGGVEPEPDRPGGGMGSHDPEADGGRLRETLARVDRLLAEGMLTSQADAASGEP